MAKRLVYSFAWILISQFLFWGVYIRWYKHGFVDWRMVLGSSLFCLVVWMMSWNAELGRHEAQKISDKVLAKHQQVQRGDRPSVQG
jgi:hypothetical protein